jgi:hypothetical protein
MGVLSAPLDELTGWLDDFEGWLDANRIVGQVANTALQPILDLVSWTGSAAQVFGNMAQQAILSEMQPIITALDIFFGAVKAIIDTIETLIKIAEGPIGVVEGVFDAIGDMY